MLETKTALTLSDADYDTIAEMFSHFSVVVTPGKIFPSFGPQVKDNPLRLSVRLMFSADNTRGIFDFAVRNSKGEIYSLENLKIAVTFEQEKIRGQLVSPVCIRLDLPASDSVYQFQSAQVQKKRSVDKIFEVNLSESDSKLPMIPLQE